MNSSSPNEATAAGAPPGALPASDAELKRWFTEEVHPHGSQLKAYLRGSFPSLRDEADDVVQESFLRIWKAKATSPIQSAKAFLYKVAKRVALDSVRHNRRSPIDAVSNLDALGVLEETPDVSAALRLQAKIDLLADIIAELPARRREIIFLCKIKRLPAEEVAGRLGIDRRTVENQLFRAVRQCEAELRARGVESLYGDEKK